jgi:hypothetical protein
VNERAESRLQYHNSGARPPVCALRLGLVDRSGAQSTYRQRDYDDTGRDQSRGELVGWLVEREAGRRGTDGWSVRSLVRSYGGMCECTRGAFS